MTRIAFAPSSSRRPVTLPVGDGAVPVEGDTPATTSPSVVAGAVFAVGDIVATFWGIQVAQGVVLGVNTGVTPPLYTVGVATIDRHICPCVRYADELTAVVW